MKTNLATVIKDYEGKDLIPGGFEEPLTYQRAIAIALNNQLEGEQIGTEEKARSFALSVKIHSGKEVTLTPTEIVYIKTQAGKLLPPLWYGRICEYLGETP